MHLAQINIARMKAPMDSEIMSDFVANLDEVNALADQSEGFVWRLTGEEDNAMAIRIFENDFLIINMSVWENIDLLHQFVYSGKHLEIYRRKKEWFHKMQDMHMVMWYIPFGHEPTPQEAREKLEQINEHGESPLAFTFKNRYSYHDIK